MNFSTIVGELPAKVTDLIKTAAQSINSSVKKEAVDIDMLAMLVKVRSVTVNVAYVNGEIVGVQIWEKFVPWIDTSKEIHSLGLQYIVDGHSNIGNIVSFLQWGVVNDKPIKTGTEVKVIVTANNGLSSDVLHRCGMVECIVSFGNSA